MEGSNQGVNLEKSSLTPFVVKFATSSFGQNIYLQGFLSNSGLKA